MIQVLEIRDDNTAVVSTEGLFRVVEPSGRVIADMMERSEAQAVADTNNYTHPNRKGDAKVIGYSEK